MGGSGRLGRCEDVRASTPRALRATLLVEGIFYERASVTGVGELAAEGGEGGGGLVDGAFFPDALDGEAVVVANFFEGAQEGAEIFVVHAGGGAVFVLGEVGVVDGADAQDVVGRFTVAEHVEEIDEEFDGGMIGAGDSLGALDDGVDEVALDAVERLDDEGDALRLGERSKEAEGLDVLFEAASGGPARGHHAGPGAAEDDDGHADLTGATEGDVGVGGERGGVDGGAGDFEIGGEEAVGGGHRERAGAEGGGVRGEVGGGGVGQKEILNVALDEIEAVGCRQSGERGGIEAEAELHRRVFNEESSGGHGK